jgi:hypothetical protein
MSISFPQEWQHLTPEEQNAVHSAAEGYISHILPTTTDYATIPALREEKTQQIAEAYLRGTVSLDGLALMSDPKHWDYQQRCEQSVTMIEPKKPQFAHLDHLISDVASVSWKNMPELANATSTLPNFKDRVAMAR